VKIVLDTNVLVAGLLSPHGPPGEIVRMAAAGALTLLYDARILSEYGDVLRRKKFGFAEEHVSPLLEYIARSGRAVASLPLPGPLPDADDEPFLEVAVAGKAECLVTGNLSHFPTGGCEGMRVLSPDRFLRFYRERARTKRTKGKPAGR